MADFRCSCPHCQQHFDVPDEMADQTIECPACKGQVLLSKPPPAAEVAPTRTQADEEKATAFPGTATAGEATPEGVRPTPTGKAIDRFPPFIRTVLRPIIEVLTKAEEPAPDEEKQEWRKELKRHPASAASAITAAGEAGLLTTKILECRKLGTGRVQSLLLQKNSLLSLLMMPLLALVYLLAAVYVYLPAYGATCICRSSKKLRHHLRELYLSGSTPQLIACLIALYIGGLLIGVFAMMLAPLLWPLRTHDYLIVTADKLVLCSAAENTAVGLPIDTRFHRRKYGPGPWATAVIVLTSPLFLFITLLIPLLLGIRHHGFAHTVLVRGIGRGVAGEHCELLVADLPLDLCRKYNIGLEDYLTDKAAWDLARRLPASGGS